MRGGWQARLAGWLDHARAVTLDALEWLPGAVTTGLVFAALIAVITLAWRQRRAAKRGGDQLAESTDPADKGEAAPAPAITATSEPAATSSDAMTDVETLR